MSSPRNESSDTPSFPVLAEALCAEYTALSAARTDHRQWKQFWKKADFGAEMKEAPIHNLLVAFGNLRNSDS